MSKNMESMRRVYETMSGGEKQYMANKLWKEDQVTCQALKEAKEAILAPAEDTYSIGDRVYIGNHGMTYLIASADESRVLFVNIETGNRYGNSMKVRHPYKIRRTELIEASGHKLTRVA